MKLNAYNEVHIYTPMKKGVKRCELDNSGTKKNNKVDALDEVLSLIEKGKGKGELKKILKLTPSALSNRLKRLDKLGCIELVGKYEINYISSSHKHPEVTRNQVHKKLNKRGHAFNFTILFPKETEQLRDKTKVIKEFNQKRITKLDNGCYRLKYKGYTIWINKESLTIYSNNYYSSKDALHSKFRQIKELDNLVKYLKERYEFRGIYGMEIFREHYGLIFNKFAEWLLKQHRKLDIKDSGNKSILWVDDSRKDDIGLKEFEGRDALEINAADNLFESHERTQWKVTPEFILEAFDKSANQINQNASHLEYHAENMRSHVGAVRELGLSVRELTTQVKTLQEENKLKKLKLEKKHSSQDLNTMGANYIC